LLDELRLVGSFALALGAATLFTPVAIRLAVRTDFYDRPVGYKGHARPTPYLGGVAVMAAFCAAAAVAFAGGGDVAWLIVAGAIVLSALGTVDDRVGLGLLPRLAVEVLLGAVIWGTGHGWDVVPSDSINLLLTVFWIVGLVNAFNLMDNMDGAAASVGAVSAAGAGTVALFNHAPDLAVLGFGLSGACVGFLNFNLARPARIFLGDGGSMPLGFVVAAIVVAVQQKSRHDVSALLSVLPLVAVPMADTCLVVISRKRRGAAILSGARDHLTHRLRSALPSARSVAFTLATAQALLCVLAAAVTRMPAGWAELTAVAWIAAFVACVLAIEVWSSSMVQVDSSA
jgi:UDP-GlcNAc:undecaprenyl-phosphate GlcNAc-1-phosphate transferase